MASSAAGPSASLAGDEGEPAWVQAFFAATPLESGMLDDVTHDCNRVRHFASLPGAPVAHRLGRPLRDRHCQGGRLTVVRPSLLGGSPQDDIPHGLQTGCEAFQRADRQHNTCGRCEKVDHDSPRVTCASCSQRGSTLSLPPAVLVPYQMLTSRFPQAHTSASRAPTRTGPSSTTTGSARRVESVRSARSAETRSELQSPDVRWPTPTSSV